MHFCINIVCAVVGLVSGIVCKELKVRSIVHSAYSLLEKFSFLFSVLSFKNLLLSVFPMNHPVVNLVHVC